MNVRLLLPILWIAVSVCVSSARVSAAVSSADQVMEFYGPANQPKIEQWQAFNQTAFTTKDGSSYQNSKLASLFRRSLIFVSVLSLSLSLGNPAIAAEALPENHSFFSLQNKVEAIQDLGHQVPNTVSHWIEQSIKAAPEVKPNDSPRDLNETIADANSQIQTTQVNQSKPSWVSTFQNLKESASKKIKETSSRISEMKEDGTRIINNQLIRAKAALQRRQEIQNLPVDQFKLPTDVLSFFMQTTEVITGDPVGWRASGLGPTYRISRDFVMPDGLSVTLTAKEVAPEEINLIPTVTYNNIQGEYENMQPTNATDSKIIRIFLESNGYMEDVDGAFADAPNSLIAFEAATNTDLPNQGFLWQGFAQLDGVKGGQDLSKGWITIYNEDGEIFLKFKPQYDPARYNAIWKNIEKRNVPNEIKIDEETITATQRFRLYFRRGLIGTIGLLLFVKYADKQNWLTRLPVIGHKFDPNGNIDSYLNSKFENRNKVDYKPQDISLENFKANFDSVHHMIVSKGNGIIWLEEHQMWKGRFNVFWNSLEDSYEYFEIYRELMELEKSGQTLSQEQIDEKNAAFQFIKNNGKPLTNFALSKDEIAKVYSKADINIATRLMDWTYAVSSGITFFLTIPFLGSPADVMLALLGAWGAVDGGFASWFDAQKSIAEKTAKDAIKNLLNFEVENSVLIADDAFEHLETSFVRFDKRFEKIASQYGKRLKKENKVFSEFKKMWEGIFPEEKGEKDPYLALLPAFFSRQSGSRIKNFSGFKAPKSGVKRFNGKVSTSILTEPIILRSSPATRLFKSSDAYRQYRKDINKKQFDFNDYGWPSPEGLLFTYRSTKRLKNGEILYLLDALPETEAYLQSYFLDKGLKKILTTRSQFYVLPEDVQMHFYNEKIIEE